MSPTTTKCEQIFCKGPDIFTALIQNLDYFSEYHIQLKILPVGDAVVYVDGRTYKQTEKYNEENDAFCDSVNALKNYKYFIARFTVGSARISIKISYT
jgi:hypothetical protein